VRNLLDGISDVPMSRPQDYGIWCGMKARCYNPNVKDYRYYGARGITVCERWRDSFAAFASDMGPRPEGFALDRIDNDGPYSPDNCRWADAKQQARNKRNNVVIVINGNSKTVSEWVELTGLKAQTIYSRLRRGTPVEPLSPKDHRADGAAKARLCIR
jgi:hypothetical protein